MTLDRPALQEVMEAVLAGKVDVVLISSLDRIGRDWGMTKQYIALLTEHKVKLLCLRERVSSDISGVSPFSAWSERRDSNPRPLGPEGWSDISRGHFRAFPHLSAQKISQRHRFRHR